MTDPQAVQRLNFVVHAAFCVRCAPYVTKVVERRVAMNSGNEYALCKEGRGILALCGDEDFDDELGTTEAGAIQSVVDEVLAKKLGKLVDIEWLFDEDHTGVPCLRVLIVLSEYSHEGYRAVEQEITCAISSVSGLFIYPKPCLESERESARKKGQRLL